MHRANFVFNLNWMSHTNTEKRPINQIELEVLLNKEFIVVCGNNLSHFAVHSTRMKYIIGVYLNEIFCSSIWFKCFPFICFFTAYNCRWLFYVFYELLVLLLFVRCAFAPLVYHHQLLLLFGKHLKNNIVIA